MALARVTKVSSFLVVVVAIGLAVVPAGAEVPVPSVVAQEPLRAPTVVAPGTVSGTASVHVPVDGDITPARALRLNVLAPSGGSPVPRTPIVVQKLPVFSTTAPFVCTGTDSCAFTRMPLYNQANPNFAWINAPPWIYALENPPVEGVIAFDTNHSMWMSTLVHGGQDRFYASWMPYGPMPGDAGSINYTFSAICGPTAQSMALMAALSTKSATTVARRGSWTDVSFIHAALPVDQTVVPMTPPMSVHTPTGPGYAVDATTGQKLTFMTPMKVDHNTLAPNAQQMTQQELQRVINMAILQRTNPASGGGFGAIIDLWHDFDYVGPLGSHSVAFSVVGTSNITPLALVGLIRQRNALVLGLHPYKAHVVTSVSLSAPFTQRTITFTSSGGHALAVEGFTGADSGDPTFILHDPMYAQRISRKLVPMGTGVQPTRVPTTLALPNGVNVLWAIEYDSSPVFADNIHDQDDVFFVDYYSGAAFE